MRETRKRSPGKGQMDERNAGENARFGARRKEIKRSMTNFFSS